MTHEEKFVSYSDEKLLTVINQAWNAISLTLPKENLALCRDVFFGVCVISYIHGNNEGLRSIGEQLKKATQT